LDHLTDAYLVHQVPIHSRSEKARLVNPRKIYVSDSGLLEADLSRMSEDRGALLENVALAHLRRQGWQPEYVVTESGLEVDFLLPARKAVDRRLIQVCWTLEDETTRKREVRALREAMKELRVKTGTIVTWNESGEVDQGIEVVPAYRWLLGEIRH
jgi:predicted AAA+ superfamily ATPase